MLRAERRAQQLAAYENQQRMIEKTEEFIEKFRYKPTKSNQVQSRIKQLRTHRAHRGRREDAATLNIKFPPAPRSGQIVAEVKEAGMSFGAKHVFSGADFTIERGQKIALVGRNGEGKTTFARMLIGQLAPTEGSIRLGANVRVGYYAQNQDDLMEGEFTVYDTLDRVAVGDIRTRLRDILGAFLFRGEEVDKKVKVLSGGERSRLAMARLMLEPYNLLVLDEPTNHMDMRSKDILKRALQKYDGTVVVVSHDREFLDGIVDKVYEFRDGGVKEYLGGIYYFLEKRKLDSLRDVERKEAPHPPPHRKTEAPKLTYEQKKEQEKLLRKLRRAVESIETELAETERRIADYDARFAAATAYDEADYKAYDDLKAHYDHLMHEWGEGLLRTRNHRKRLTSPMNVLLLNASPHPAGIVSQALDAAASTARQAGAETVKAELYRAPIAPLHGMYALPRDQRLSAAARRGARVGRSDPPRRPARRRDTDLLGRDGRAAETALRTARAGLHGRIPARNSAAASQRAAGRRHRRLHHAVALQSALPPEPGRRAQRTRSALDGRHAHPLGRDRRHQSARRSSARSRQAQNRTARGAGPENEMTLRYG